jgi:hypothetical protein
MYLKYLFYPFLFLTKLFGIFFQKQEIEEKNTVEEGIKNEKKYEEVEID